MPDIRIVPGSSIMSFTSSLNFLEKLTQDPSGSLNLYGSGSTGRTDLFSIDGNNGRLFSVSDDLSDSLFSVNTIAGLPVIEAFADNTVNIGQYGVEAIKVSGSRAFLTGSLFGTASYATFAQTPTVTGATGVIGVSGATGVIGVSGATGVVGVSGATGVIGVSGATGVIGVSGATGVIGVSGATGVIGVSGATGVIGVSGATGAIGVTGATGPSTAINATNDTTTTVLYPVTVGAAGSNQTPKVRTTSTAFSFNASTSTLTAGAFSGAGTGLTGLTNTNLSGTAGITNANLANSAIQIGSTVMSLGTAYSDLTGLGTVRAGANGASSPPFAFTGDTNTGMYNVSADVLGFATGGSARLIINSSGDVGISTTGTPEGKLHVNQTSTLGGTTGNSLLLQTLQNSGGSGGNVVLVRDYAVRDATGTAWTTWRHHNSIDIDGVYNTPGTNTRCFWERDPLSGIHYFGNSANYTLTVDGDNNRVGIGITAPTYRLQVSDTIASVTAFGNFAALQSIGGTGYRWTLANDSTFRLQYTTDGFSSVTTPLFITSTGNVGIGTTSPASRLDVSINDNSYTSALTVSNTNTGTQALSQLVLSTANNSTGLFQIRQFNNGGAVEMANYANAPVNFWTSGSERMRIHANGKVSVNNTDNTTGQFSVSNNASVTAYNTTFRMTEGATFKNDTIVGWNVAGQYSHFGNYQSFPLALRTNDTARIWIAAGGNVGIGTTSPSYPLHVGIDVSGTSIYASADIVAYSDESVKENVRPIENVIERIQQSRGVLYDRTDIESKDNIGFIAQELEVAFPELVVTNEDGTKAVKYQNTVAVLFEAIKDQQKQIEQLKQIVNGFTK
jgi:hypothetical protein